MRTKTLAVIAIALLTLSSCRWGSAIKMISEEVRQAMTENHDYENKVAEWGEVMDLEVEEPQPFSQIQLNGNINIVFTQDSTFSVKMHGNKKAVEAYKYWWSEDKIVFNTQEGYTYDATKNNLNIDKNTPAITLYVTAPELSAIEIYGASNIEVNDGLKQNCALNIHVNGASNVDVGKVKIGGSLTINISGGGNITVAGTQCSADAIMHIQGAGNIEGNIKCADLDAEIDGAGNVTLDVHGDNVTATCNGVGEINITGEHKSLKQTNNGM